MHDPATQHVKTKRERVPSRRRASDIVPTPTAVMPSTRVVDSPHQGGLDREVLLTLQRTVGNATVQRRLHDLQRDDGPPPTKDPSADEPKQAKLPDAAEKVVKHYAEKYLGGLKDEAKKRLADAWRESPAGVIAAGAIIGGAGVGYLVGTKSALPGLPAIPLDVLGGPFEGATIQLKLDGPVTSPEAFKFTITFKEKGGKKRHVSPDALKHPTIDTFANPEAIATEVDGPAFASQVPDDPEAGLGGANLSTLVRLIGNGLLEGARRKIPVPTSISASCHRRRRPSPAACNGHRPSHRRRPGHAGHDRASQFPRLPRRQAPLHTGSSHSAQGSRSGTRGGMTAERPEQRVIGRAVHEPVRLFRVVEAHPDQPAPLVRRLVDQSGTSVRIVVRLHNLAVDRGDEIFGRLGRLDQAKRLVPRQVVTGIGQLQVDDVAELLLRVVGDSDRRDVAVDSHPNVGRGIAKILRSCHRRILNVSVRPTCPMPRKT